MASQGCVGLLGGISCLLVTTLGHAECRMDNDCPGELVCEAGSCVAPAALPPPPPAPPAATVGAPLANSAPASIANEAPSEPREVKPAKRRWRRHSIGLMVVGIVSTSAGGLALMVSAVTALNIGDCRDQENNLGTCKRDEGFLYGSLFVGLALAGIGVPLIVIGRRREPLGYASVTPWAAPHAGGLSLRFDL